MKNSNVVNFVNLIKQSIAQIDGLSEDVIIPSNIFDLKPNLWKLVHKCDLCDYFGDFFLQKMWHIVIGVVGTNYTFSKILSSKLDDYKKSFND